MATLLTCSSLRHHGRPALRVMRSAPAASLQAVVAGVSVRYQQLADDTLSTVRKTESSLKRLKTRQKLAADGGEGGAGAWAGCGAGVAWGRGQRVSGQRAPTAGGVMEAVGAAGLHSVPWKTHVEKRKLARYSRSALLPA